MPGTSVKSADADVYAGLGGRVMPTSHGSVDKSLDIDWMQELLDTYVQADPLKAQVNNQKYK